MQKATPVGYSPVQIPTVNSFLQQYHRWIIQKVSVHFKRNKDRIPDITQDVIVRLIQKDFVGRWFFKHLVEDLVDTVQGSRICGFSLSTQRTIRPVQGKVTDPKSLWRMGDVLRLCNFDYASYYYSPQNHTIPSSKVLELLGETDVSILESMYRQGRLLPSGFTEHRHVSRHDCVECTEEKVRLKKLGLSLNVRWRDSAEEAMKLRWNDTQLTPLLRSFKGRNAVRSMPEYIMRTAENTSIDAGLLKYAHLVISHSVYNSFKSMGRRQDLEMYADSTTAAQESTGIESVQKESIEDPFNTSDMRAGDSPAEFQDTEAQHDLENLIHDAELTEEERLVLTYIDLKEEPIALFAARNNLRVTRVHKIRNSALEAIRYVAD